MRFLTIIWLVMAVLLLGSGCGEERFSPKPRAFPRVEYPEKVYQSFDADFCAFTFEFPAYTKIVQDTTYFQESPVHPCWFDIFYPDFDSRIHCSYYPIGEGKIFAELKQDAFELAEWHQKKANYIDEIRIDRGENVHGFAFDIQGPAASPFQFYLTDSTTHFLRGALYFNTQVRPDSLEPVYEFVKEDILHLIETFEWTEEGGR